LRELVPRTCLGDGIPATPLPAVTLCIQRSDGMASGLTSQPIADRPPGCLFRRPGHIPASGQLARWEAAKVVLRLHARQFKLCLYPAVPLGQALTAIAEPCRL
jgi:hypothetical protein